MFITNNPWGVAITDLNLMGTDDLFFKKGVGEE